MRSLKQNKMKQIASLIIAGIISISLLSCSGSDYIGKPVGKIVNVDSITKLTSKENLASIYTRHGNIINQKGFPYYVKANELNTNSRNWLLIDIRSENAYESGHINGAYNVPKEEIIDFLTEKQLASAYEKLIIICYSGQMAAYVTGVLRYAGIDNAYTLLHGMASWNSQFSGILKKNFGLNYRNMIVKSEVNINEKVSKHEEDVNQGKEKVINLDNLPKLEEGSVIPNILGRARALLNKPIKDFLIKPDVFFPDLKRNPDKYYTVYYKNKKGFDAGHIKGAHLFKVRKDLSLNGKLTDLPKDKPIVIYCKSGHTGAQAAAYLDMLGYDAYNLMFGENGFSFSIFTEDISGLTSDFPVIEGKKRSNNLSSM